MSRSNNQSHPIARNKNARRPRPDRKRKHKPYGFHTTKYSKFYEAFKKNKWSLDCQEYWDSSNVSNKTKGRREGKKEIERQINEIT